MSREYNLANCNLCDFAETNSESIEMKAQREKMALGQMI